MITVIETLNFEKQASKIWSDEERLDFIEWVISNTHAGDVVPESQGARKVRWSMKGQGKRGGVRVIYFNQTSEGLLYLLAIYKKSKQSNMTPNEIKKELK